MVEFANGQDAARAVANPTKEIGRFMAYSRTGFSERIDAFTKVNQGVGVQARRDARPKIGAGPSSHLTRRWSKADSNLWSRRGNAAVPNLWHGSLVIWTARAAPISEGDQRFESDLLQR